jgi:flagellar FliJ protein
VDDAAPFLFRLERVRSLKERAEDLAREDLARELAHRIRGEAMLFQARELVASAAAAGLGAVTRPGGASGGELLAAQAWIERTEQRRREASLEVDRCDAEVAARRAALAAAAQEREAIERLKRRRRADHEHEAARRAQVTLDEVALAVHRRGAQAA